MLKEMDSLASYRQDFGPFPHSLSGSWVWIRSGGWGQRLNLQQERFDDVFECICAPLPTGPNDGAVIGWSANGLCLPVQHVHQRKIHDNNQPGLLCKARHLIWILLCPRGWLLQFGKLVAAIVMFLWPCKDLTLRSGSDDVIVSLVTNIL